MQRYFIEMSFDGSAYHGWQIQPHSPSVQEVLQRALSTLLGAEVAVTGAGRTDTGVHAHTMVAHFDWQEPLDAPQLAYRLNRILPRDIAVRSVRAVAESLHARFSEVSRTYHYYIHQQKNPFLRTYSWEVHYDLDFPLMNRAAEYLLTVEDFGAFCKAGSDAKTTLCTVTEARWVKITPSAPPSFETEQPFGGSQVGEAWCFIITANRFLRNMVRAVVGTLIEVGRHRMTLDEFKDVVACGSRSAAGESVPAHGLFLWDVAYNEE